MSQRGVLFSLTWSAYARANTKALLEERQRFARKALQEAGNSFFVSWKLFSLSFRAKLKKCLSIDAKGHLAPGVGMYQT